MLKLRPGPAGFQVDRGRFDQLLLAAAGAAGVRIIQPAQALPPRATERGWLISARQGGSLHRIAARFLVDATGRHAILCRRKRRYSAPTIAIYGYWRSPLLDGPETRVEAGADAWFWGAPLPDGTFNAAVFVDPAFWRARVAAGLEACYRSLLAESALLRGCLAGELVSGCLACDASSHVDEHPADDRSIKVGEASFSIDPLSSQGVQAAMMSGLQGSIVAHTTLTHPEQSAIAQAFYRSCQLETVASHHALVAHYYAEQRAFGVRPFWRSRAIAAPQPNRYPIPPVHGDVTADTAIILSPAAKLIAMPCIQGDLITLARALTHPALERPVAYLGDVALAPLADALTPRASASEILRRWSRQLAPPAGMGVLRWMWSHGILVAADA